MAKDVVEHVYIVAAFPLRNKDTNEKSWALFFAGPHTKKEWWRWWK